MKNVNKPDMPYRRNGNMGIHNCKDCKLYKELFCIGDKEPFFEDMWNKHDKKFPEAAKKLREIIDKKSRLQIKSERRKKNR